MHRECINTRNVFKKLKWACTATKLCVCDDSLENAMAFNVKKSPITDITAYYTRTNIH